uniref:Glycoprotein Ib platelet subunit beta n=1 Tax=Oryzias latipes TaxID=8090 RepID=A0A3P9K8B2_ORYLA
MFVCAHNLTATFISESQLAVKHSSSPHTLRRIKDLQRKRLVTMARFLLLYSLLLFGGQRSSACPEPCSCRGGRVDCSSRSLTSSSMPTSFPAGATELLLHDNLITTLPNGLLDGLSSLRSVSLQGNPWLCDCGVLYLRAWLRRHSADLMAHVGVNCSSPPSLKGRLVAYLTEEEVLDSCQYWYCNLAFASFICLFVFVAAQAALLVALIIFLKRFERLSKEARRTTEEILAVGESPRENEYERLKDSSI